MVLVKQLKKKQKNKKVDFFFMLLDTLAASVIPVIDFTLKSKSLLDYTDLFYSNEYIKKDKIILKYF